MGKGNTVKEDVRRSPNVLRFHLAQTMLCTDAAPPLCDPVVHIGLQITKHIVIPCLCITPHACRGHRQLRLSSGYDMDFIHSTLFEQHKCQWAASLVSVLAGSKDLQW